MAAIVAMRAYHVRITTISGLTIRGRIVERTFVWPVLIVRIVCIMRVPAMGHLYVIVDMLGRTADIKRMVLPLKFHSS